MHRLEAEQMYLKGWIDDESKEKKVTRPKYLNNASITVQHFSNLSLHYCIK